VTRQLGLLLGIASLAVAWLLLAPVQLGGAASYVVVDGASMEPGLERGDLVIVRKAAAYREGDVVAYRHPELRRTVLHRVVRTQGERLQLKGDANGFRDFAAPRRLSVVGKKWVHVPNLGRGVEWLRAPANAAATAVFLALLVGGTGAGRARRRRARIAVEATLRKRPQLAGPGAETALPVLAAVAGLLLVLGLAAVTKPATRVVAAEDVYRHQGAFSYTGEASRGEVYPAGRVGSGETVFVRLVPSLRVRFDYRLESAAARSVFGTASLVARVQGDNGWSRELPLVRQRAFDGDAVRLEGRLDLRGLLALGDRVAAATGTAGDSYLVTLVPRVRVGGTVDERTISDSFAPALALRLDRQRLRLERAGGLARSQAGTGTRAEPNRLALLGLGIDVGTARVVGLGGGLLLLLVAGGVWLLLQAARRGDEPTRIATRLGPWLVDVAPQDRAGSVHDLAAIDDLVRLAERYERVILHERRGPEHSYLVEEAGAVYRYRAHDLSPHGELEAAAERWTQILRAAVGR
jgi:signal peptidase I